MRNRFFNRISCLSLFFLLMAGSSSNAMDYQPLSINGDEEKDDNRSFVQKCIRVINWMCHEGMSFKDGDTHIGFCRKPISFSEFKEHEGEVQIRDFLKKKITVYKNFLKKKGNSIMVDRVLYSALNRHGKTSLDVLTPLERIDAYLEILPTVTSFSIYDMTLCAFACGSLSVYLYSTMDGRSCIGYATDEFGL